MREERSYGGRRDDDYGDSGGFSSFRGNMGPSTAPVKVGDELTVTIEAVGVKGDGIAKKDGFVLFIANTKAGQSVKIRVTKVLRKVGFAEVVGGSAGAAGSAPAEATSSAPAEAPQEEPAAEDSEDFGE